MAGHRGDAASAQRLIADCDADVRAAALGALARLGTLSAGQVDRALSDEAAQVRRRAAELAPAEVQIVHLLDDPDPSVVEAVAAALGERDWDAGPVGALCRVARSHDDPLCRESAVAALGAIAAGLDESADPENGAPVGHATHDYDTQDGANQDNANQDNAIQDNASRDTASRDIASRDSASGSTPHFATGDASRPRANARLDDDRAEILEVLLAAMEDRPQIRRRALLGLYQFDDEAAIAAVHSALEDRDRQVRAVAGELLSVPVR